MFYEPKKRTQTTSGREIPEILDYYLKTQNKSKQAKEPSMTIEVSLSLTVNLNQSLFKKLRETIMQSDAMWNLIKQKLDIRGDHLNFNEFLRLLEAESYFRDIMFEYQLFYKSTKRLRYHKEVHLSNKRMGENGEQIVKGVPQKLQAAHIIEKVLLFEAKGTTILVCAFENKNVHAVDYMTGDIIHEFVFKDESMPIAAPAPAKHQSVTVQPSPKKDLGKKIMRY